MKDFEAGFVFGMGVGILFCVFLSISMATKTATGWCEDIAQHDTTTTYQMSYDKCMAEWEQRKK